MDKAIPTEISGEIRRQFAGKKITLMGLGLLGRGIGDARFFAAAGAELIVTDLKTADELAPSIAALAEFPNITYHLGGHQLADFENRDLIIRAPNAPLDSPFLAHARRLGIPVEMDSSLFAKLAAAISLHPPESKTQSTLGVTIVGITGTRGKTTTTHLIYEMARAANANQTTESTDDITASRETLATNSGKFSRKNIWLGGNERDTATLPLIEKVRAGDIVVLELDSWQLQGFAEDKISPHISVWANFMPDHMNYYKGDMDRYFEDKAAIARFQKPGDFFIAPRDIKEKIETRFGKLAGTWVEPFANLNESHKNGEPNDWEIALPGEHNRANAACAIAAARALGISDEIIKNVLKHFTALPNRLEPLGEKNGIAFYNDSNSTTPDATIAALRTLRESASTKNRPIILIAGGSDKALDFSNLARELLPAPGDKNEKSIKKIILFEGKASEKLKALLPKDFVANITMASTMAQAVEAAQAAAEPGDIILLSPAATSFGLFKNEYDRGDQFRAIVEEMKS